MRLVDDVNSLHGNTTTSNSIHRWRTHPISNARRIKPRLLSMAVLASPGRASNMSWVPPGTRAMQWPLPMLRTLRQPDVVTLRAPSSINHSRMTGAANTTGTVIGQIVSPGNVLLKPVASVAKFENTPTANTPCG